MSAHPGSFNTMKRERLPDNIAVVKRPRPGPVTKYDPKLLTAARLMAQHGAIQSELADLFEVDTRTFSRWLHIYPELREAVMVGNEVFDSRVERAAAERAIGFYADDYTWRETTEAERKKDPKLPQFVLIPTGRKYYPPSEISINRWLKNRMPHKWRDKQEQDVKVPLLSTEDALKDLHKRILDLKADGYLEHVPLPVLSPPEDEEE
jgi:hypothetical protein